jgi:hypothetical protein
VFKVARNVSVVDSAVECVDSCLDRPPALLKESLLVVIEEGPQAVASAHAAENGRALLGAALLDLAR